MWSDGGEKKRRTETCGPDSVNGDRHMAMPLGRDGCIYLCGRVVLWGEKWLALIKKGHVREEGWPGFSKGKKIFKKIYDCVVGVVVILLKKVISKIKIIKNKRKKENGGQTKFWNGFVKEEREREREGQKRKERNGIWMMSLTLGSFLLGFKFLWLLQKGIFEFVFFRLSCQFCSHLSSTSIHLIPNIFFFFFPLKKKF